MCARWPTIAMSKFFSEVWTKLLPLHGCHVMRFGVMCLWFDLLSNDVASCEVICGTTPTYYSSTTLYSVLQSTTPVLLCTTKYYSSTTLYYKVLLQYCSPVLQRTTLYYKVLLQYYSVLQSTTPVLLCTTKYYSVLQSTTRYYSSTTLYYKVLLQYYSPVLQRTTKYYKVLLQYSVLQSTTPVLLCTTKYYASTTRTTKYYSGTTLYYKVLLRYYSVLHSTTPVLLCTTQYYNVLLCTAKYYNVLVLQSTTTYYSSTTLYYKVLLQYHSVLQSTTPVLLLNVIYNARRNKSQRPTSPNTAPATQNECHQWSASHMKRHFQCVEQLKSPSNLTKYCAYHEILKLKISADTPWMLPPIERRFEDIRG